MNIIKEKINMSDELKEKIKKACKFCKCTYRIKEGHLHVFEGSNIGYISPHCVLIEKQIYFFYNDVTYFWEHFKEEKIPLQNLVDYIARH